MLVDRLREAVLKPAQALYLIWNQDLSGKSAPDAGADHEFARTLRAGFAAIESEFAIVDDPDGRSPAHGWRWCTATRPPTSSSACLNNTFVSDVAYSHGQATLEQLILDAAPGRIAYDDFRKRLSFTGVMTTTMRDALKVAT